jgi:hypothetical protein
MAWVTLYFTVLFPAFLVFIMLLDASGRAPDVVPLDLFTRPRRSGPRSRRIRMSA